MRADPRLPAHGRRRVRGRPGAADPGRSRALAEERRDGSLGEVGERGRDDAEEHDADERDGEREAAGERVAKGLFYWYFDTKEAVFRDLAHDLRHRLRRAQAEAMDPAADPLVRIRQGSEASVRFMAAHAQAFALVTVENVDRQFVDDIRRGTEVHADDTERLVKEAIAAGLVRDEDPRLLAYAVLTTVGWFSHFRHTGRLDLDVEELAAFVGRQVVCSIAASEQIAREALEAPPAVAAN
jgi:AcrR family transcriptional regulator